MAATTAPPVAAGPSNHGLADLKTVDKLVDLFQQIKETRSKDERDYALNRAFFSGDQWVIWNRVTSQVETLPQSTTEQPRWKVRLTSDQIRPGVNHYVALMTKNRPTIHAVPDTGADKDIKAAQTAEMLYDWWWKELSLNAKLQTALTDAQLSGGYWKIDFDQFAGKPMEVTFGPDGQPITDPQFADLFKDELRNQAPQYQMDPEDLVRQFTKTIATGEIRVEVMPGEKVYLDPSVTNFEDCKYAICVHDLPTDEIKARWGYDVPADATPTEDQAPLAYRRAREKKMRSTHRVYVAYFRPQATLPKGRYVVWLQSPDKILQDEPWSYPFMELPLVKFPGMERPNSPFDDPRVTIVRPLQKELNRTLSQVVQHKDMSIKPQMMAAYGQMRGRQTDEPGALVLYNPMGNGQIKPEWRDIPQLPSSAFNLLGDIQNRIDRMFNRIPSSRDALPARVDSGNTVELIQEAVADQMTPEVRRLEDSLARAGKIMACYAKKYYTEPKMIQLLGPGGTVKSRKFMNSDLQGGFSFHAMLDTGLPRTRAGRIQTIKELLEMQLIDPKMALKHLELGEFNGLYAQVAADEDQAAREHDKILQGQPLNPLALADIEQQVQQGMNPATGAPIASPADIPQIQAAMQQAVIQPLDYEDWDTHIATHAAFMKQPEFENWPQEAQQTLLQHYNATYQRKMEVMKASVAMDPKALPGLSVAARSTVSAPVMQQILERHGIEVDEQAILEPPLETMVYDSVDKPDAEEVAGNPLTPQDLALYEESLNKQGSQQQQMQHAQQKHEQQLRHADEMHQAKLTAANRPPAQGGGTNGR